MLTDDQPQKLIEPKKARLHGLDEGQQQELEELETGEVGNTSCRSLT